MDLVNWVAKRAVDRFGDDKSGVFNVAGFQQEFRKVSGSVSMLDGKAVDALLHGRRDIEPLYGGNHYRLLPPPKP